MVCLDAWAVLAWLNDEGRAAGRVESHLDDAAMSWINVAEVYNAVRRLRGEDRAELVRAWLERHFSLDAATPQRDARRARLKAVHPMSLAHCFAVATAVALDAPLLTGDPEITGRPGLGCRVVDLRG